MPETAGHEEHDRHRDQQRHHAAADRAERAGHDLRGRNALDPAFDHAHRPVEQPAEHPTADVAERGNRASRRGPRGRVPAAPKLRETQ